MLATWAAPLTLHSFYSQICLWGKSSFEWIFRHCGGLFETDLTQVICAEYLVYIRCNKRYLQFYKGL